MPRLKVFCTTSGFHDAVVAAPSRPAALKAWGAKTDLFSLGAARQVTDHKLAKKALERPGAVIRVKRGDDEEVVSTPRRKPKSRKAPSRARLTAAEQKLAKLDEKQGGELRAIDRELKALEDKRHRLEARHAKARSSAEQRVEEAREAYEAAFRRA